MPVRIATCACGQLTAHCSGEPVGVSVCHCNACKVLSGSAFSWNARWPVEAVTIAGDSRTHARTGDEGSVISNRFCPNCGVTVAYTIDALPDHVIVRAGCFGDPAFPAPQVSVYDPARLCQWLNLTADPLTRWN